MPGADRRSQAQPVGTLDLIYDGPATDNPGSPCDSFLHGPRYLLNFMLRADALVAGAGQ
jgi:hypothetical protein